jgi:hypothetical protein
MLATVAEIIAAVFAKIPEVSEHPGKSSQIRWLERWSCSGFHGSMCVVARRIRNPNTRRPNDRQERQTEDQHRDWAFLLTPVLGQLGSAVGGCDRWFHSSESKWAK